MYSRGVYDNYLRILIKLISIISCCVLESDEVDNSKESYCGGKPSKPPRFFHCHPSAVSLQVPEVNCTKSLKHVSLLCALYRSLGSIVIACSRKIENKYCLRMNHV